MEPEQRAESAASAGVFVVGSHRSGTSAVTGVIDALGVHACRAEDRFPARRWNARGNFESRSLSRFDDDLLRMLGGVWWAPPPSPHGWEDHPALAEPRARAAQLFASVHPDHPWVWKDPRACVLLPFWDGVLSGLIPRVIVLRRPHDVAASLRARDEMGTDHALALVDRNLHAALRDSAGHPALILSFDDAVDTPAETCGAIAEFLASCLDGWHAPDDTRSSEAFLDSLLRHHGAEESGPPGGAAADDRLRVWQWAMDMRGAHASLAVDDLPQESPRTGLALAAALAALTS